MNAEIQPSARKESQGGDDYEDDEYEQDDYEEDNFESTSRKDDPVPDGTADIKDTAVGEDLWNSLKFPVDTKTLKGIETDHKAKEMVSPP